MVARLAFVGNYPGQIRNFEGTRVIPPASAITFGSDERLKMDTHSIYTCCIVKAIRIFVYPNFPCSIDVFIKLY